MKRKHNIFRTAFVVLSMVSMLIISGYDSVKVQAASGYGFVILGTYSRTLAVGESFYLPVITSNGRKATFSSSNTKVASVNTYGKITAKKAGSATIRAKIKNGEAECKIVVKKTVISLSKKSVTLENNQTVTLKATVSTGHPVTWKSGKKSVATVDEDGKVAAKKPGSTVITASVDGISVSCKVTVKQPSVRLDQKKLTLYRKNIVKLSVISSSGSVPKWKTNKKSVATVDAKGNVTAVKHGTAIITVTVDGVSKSCEVTVKSPNITFEKDTLTLLTGEQKRVTATVSSGNLPVYSSSNSNVAAVDERGKITAKSSGRAYIYASEDGTKERITVYVKSPDKQ